MKNVLIIQTKKFHRGLEQNKRNENHAVLSKNRTLQMFMLGIIFFSFSFFIEGQNNSSVSSIQFLQNQSSFNKLSSMASTSTSNIASLNQYNLSFSTYFGGTADESSSSIAVDGNGNSYITGSTDSLNFPVKNAFQSILNGSSDAFVAKFNATGSLMFSTYFGGLVSNPKIAVDNNGNSYIIGSTTSNTFPVKNAFQSILNGSSNAFVAKFNATGSLMFSTYFGNSNTNGYGITVDSYGDSYITGQTNSNSFPVKNAFQSTLGGIFNAFVAKFNATGSLVFSTYLGGNGQDNGDGITVDNNGNSYITGATSSTNFPLKNAYSTTYNSNLYRIFVTKLNATGNGLIFSTYFGGNAFNAGDIGSGIAIENNNICITGSTTSPDFPLKNPLQSTLNGPHDALLTIFNTTGNGLIFSTYLGNYSNGYGLAVDANANIYLSGFINSDGLPIKNAFQTTFNGGYGDAFITKFTSFGSANQNYLYGYWKMDETNGPVLDSSGNGHNGLIYGGITRGQPGIFNFSYAFNGINAYVGIGNMSQSLSLQTPISISIWFKANSNRSMGLFTQSAYITTSSLNSFYNESRGINVLPNGSIEFFSRDANSMLKYVITGPYQQNIWHQIVLVQNQSLVYGYIDSIMVLELNMGSYLTSYDNFFTIGRGTNTTDFFQGNVDDVRVYTTALTNTNVTALYKQSSLPVPTVNNTQNPPTNNSSITNTLTLSSPGFTITSILITGGICTIGIVIWKEKRRK